MTDKRDFFYKHDHLTAAQERENEALIQRLEQQKKEQPNGTTDATRHRPGLS